MGNPLGIRTTLKPITKLLVLASKHSGTALLALVLLFTMLYQQRDVNYELYSEKLAAALEQAPASRGRYRGLRVCGEVVAQSRRRALEQQLDLMTRQFGRLRIAFADFPHSARAIQNGDWLCVKAKLRVLGRGYYDEYLKTQRVTGFGYGGYLPPIPSWDARQTEAETLVYELSRLGAFSESASLLIALGLAIPDVVSRETKELFRLYGMSHVLVISGFHLGVIFGLLFGFANLTLRRSYYFAQFHYLTHFSSFVALAGTTLYLLYATPQPPIVRAYCALVLTVFLATSTRRLFALRTMLTAALVVSWIWPGALLTVGPQLSFAAVGGIVFSLYLFRGASSLVNYFIVCVGAWTATAPVVLYHFGELQLLAPLFNAVFAVPLCVILVVGGGAAALLMQVSRSLGGLLFVVCEAAVSNILALLLYCQAFAEQTLFIVQNEKPQAALIATLVAILASGFVYVLFGGRGQDDRLLSHE